MNNDQQIMENLLLTTKGVCDLYLHGAIESATPDVHQAFDGALGESLDMQSDIYAQPRLVSKPASRHTANRAGTAEISDELILHTSGLSPPSPPPMSAKRQSLAHVGGFMQFSIRQKRRCQAQPELA